MDLILAVNGQFVRNLLVVLGVPVGVDTVTEDGHVAASYESQVKDKVAGIPVGQGFISLSRCE